MSTQKPLNPWDYKPWWCQPWSILLTGIIIITGSWGVLRSVWVTVLISMPILAWWTFFLLLWPQFVRRSVSDENNPQSSQDSMT